MIDSVKVYVKAGDGGGGCTSFRGIKFTRSRRADGGFGGRGADIIVQADRNTRSLEHLQFQQHFRGENGKFGQANKKKGACVRPSIIKVPPGTVISDFDNNLLIRELLEDGDSVIVAKAGEGGRGNNKSAEATAGLPGEEKRLLLEFKLIADVGIIGYPNSGKSTFLSKVSSARPKIADYPFTTTSVCLCTLDFEDFTQPETLILLEFPGIVKNADCGKGVGNKFLRHAERLKLLIHMVDISGQDGRDPVDDYLAVNEQLRIYGKDIINIPQIIVANKIDQPQAQANLARFSSQVKQRVFAVSGLTTEGISAVTKYLKDYFSQGACDEGKKDI